MTVAVVGAGFSGLSAAWYLSRAGYDVDVYEALDRPGGIIQTLTRDYGCVETAAGSLLNSPEVEELFADLQLPMRTLQGKQRKKWLWLDGRATTRFISGTEWLRILFLVLPRWLFVRSSLAPREHESIRQWGFRTLGTRLTQNVLETALQGIYAGNPQRLSAQLILGRFFSSTKGATQLKAVKAPSLTQSSGSVSPVGGMGNLFVRWVEQLETQGVRFHWNKKVQARELLQHIIICTLPAYQILDFLDGHQTQDDFFWVQQVEYQPIVSVTTFSEGDTNRFHGFGCLFPAQSGFNSLGLVGHDGLFQPTKNDAIVAERWILPGSGFKGSVDEIAEQAKNKVTEDYHKFYRCSPKWLDVHVQYWPKGIPHYTTELEYLLREHALRRNFNTNNSNIGSNDNDFDEKSGNKSNSNAFNKRSNNKSNNILLFSNFMGHLGLGKILLAASELPHQLRQWTECE